MILDSMIFHSIARKSSIGSEPSTRRLRHIGRRTGDVALTVAAAALLFGCTDGERPATSASGRLVTHPAALANPLPGHPRGANAPGRCRGTIRGVTVAEVRVPSGATCRLHGTTVTGNVSIGSTATLVAHR